MLEGPSLLNLLEELATGKLKVAKINLELPRDWQHYMLSEVLDLVVKEDGSNVSWENHGTNWTKPFGSSIQHNILNTHGRYDDQVGHGLTVFGASFPEPTTYPNIAEFVKFFPHAVNMRINSFGAQSGLAQHKETTIVRQNNGKLGLKVRFHYPVLTNNECLVFLDGEYHHLKPDNLYFFNNGCVHAAENRGEDCRVHIVFDMLLTQLVADTFFSDYEVLDPVRYGAIDPDAPVDGPARWDGEEEIHLFEVQ